MDRAALIRNLLLALAALGAALPAAAQTPRVEVSGGEASGTDIALQAGGGMQLRLTDRFGVRGDYLHILADEGGVNAFRFAADVVLLR
jgi:hypothetical protein